jgi:hypothetical protein
VARLISDGWYRVEVYHRPSHPRPDFARTPRYADAVAVARTQRAAAACSKQPAVGDRLSSVQTEPSSWALRRCVPWALANRLYGRTFGRSRAGLRAIEQAEEK